MKSCVSLCVSSEQLLQWIVVLIHIVLVVGNCSGVRLEGGLALMAGYTLAFEADKKQRVTGRCIFHYACFRDGLGHTVGANTVTYVCSSHVFLYNANARRCILGATYELHAHQSVLLMSPLRVLYVWVDVVRKAL
jgi:hypothetical protein